MGEPNQTVDPFLTAGVRLPSQGIAYVGISGVVATVALVASVGAPIPRNALGGPLAVDIPFAAVGDILEIALSVNAQTDTGSGTPATVFSALLVIDDSSIAPAEIITPASGDRLLPATGQATSVLITGGLLVKPTWVFPVTITGLYASDGDSVLGTNAFVGGAFGSASLRVKRVPRQRALSLPSMIST